MLAFDDPRWGELSHAYGPATDTPILLKMLETSPNQEAGDPLVSEDPWNLLWGSICHQGSIYSASYAAVPHLVRIASLAADPLPVGYLLLPTSIVSGCGRGFNRGPMPSDLEDSYFQAVAKLPQLIPRMMRADLDERAALAIAEAVLILCGHWELGEGIGRMDLPDVERYWEFRPVFQYLADVKTWEDFPNEEFFRFMSTPGDTR